MMGPYMAPMAVNVPLTVTFSTLCALTVVPWITHLLLKNSLPEPKKKAGFQTRITGIYRSFLSPFLEKKWLRYLLLGLILAGLAASAALVFSGWFL